MTASVKSAVFPVAGFGTRVLPATKSIPKEMLPVVDRPLIHYAVTDAVEAGVERIVLVTGRNKGALEDYFDIAYELDRSLEMRGKEEARAAIRAFLLRPGRVLYVRQMEPLGLGHAVWCARHAVADGPFLVVSPDDLIVGETSSARQLIEAHARTGGAVVAAMDVPRAEVGRYGVIDTDSPDGALVPIRGLIEKPAPEAAPSTLAVIAHYLLPPDVFAILEEQQAGAGGEIQLTDAIAALIGRTPVHGLRFSGRRLDCGTTLGWLEANIAMALQHDEYRAAVLGFLKQSEESGAKRAPPV
ncbi:MAG: UTP--glucose-1-phosphate uridylyltransferase [Alphaproteobacteria bacterium]|nr:UTP--glucose-1-phosphate uridylyltransferase [Alphaproteobacteria bacterium]